MRILFVIPPPYLPNRLHRNRSFDLIRILAKTHEVHLLSITTHKEMPNEFKEIKKVCKSVNIIYLNPKKALLNCAFFPFLPFEVAFCKSKLAKKTIMNIVKVKKIDLIYLKRLRSAIFMPKTNIPIILDSTDAISMFYNRLSRGSSFPKKIFYKLEEIKYKAFERKIMKQIKNWIACSEIDKKYLESIDASCNLYVVPNPVDTTYFSPLRHSGMNSNYSRSLLFRGLMEKRVNIDAISFFVEKIFPIIQKQIKDIKLYIVGPKPNAIIKNYHNNRNIFVTGFAKDIREYIAKTDLTICPVRIASGTRFKITQAWSMGRPVISTTIGAEGLVLKKNENILIADDPKEFAKHITDLLKNKELYDKLAQIGRKTVMDEYCFTAVSQKLEIAIKNAKNIK